MPPIDGFLRPVPSDADRDDGRLYDPTSFDISGTGTIDNPVTGLAATGLETFTGAAGSASVVTGLAATGLETFIGAGAFGAPVTALAGAGSNTVAPVLAEFVAHSSRRRSMKTVVAPVQPAAVSGAATMAARVTAIIATAAVDRFAQARREDEAMLLEAA